MIDPQSLSNALDKHQAADSTEEKHLAACRALLSRHPLDGWSRATREGHFTASAWVTDRGKTRALLLHHAKLNRWLQPGGHIDETDVSPAEAALREAREESGLAVLALADGTLFDVDVHAIPARGAEPAHLHYDLRYHLIAGWPAGGGENDVVLSSESLGARWVDLMSLCGDNAETAIEPGLLRMARKSLALYTP